MAGFPAAAPVGDGVLDYGTSWDVSDAEVGGGGVEYAGAGGGFAQVVSEHGGTKWEA